MDAATKTPARKPAAKKAAAKKTPAKKPTAAKATAPPAPKPAAGEPRGPREGSAMFAALTILKAEGKPLRADEILKLAAERQLKTGLKGKTPAATLQASLAVAAKTGRFGLHRPEPGRYAVKAAA